ncbi:hypothetical protein [Stenomitos frigidus]|uniref:Uncharacterized protein n=1 Tax=Stenomitos frigidus ULC18 TaxID=2107698 RepID=A0A2T1E1D0_9CYAN|nr:hypothetical protein [Stenomitos frigidus]PSB26539.1 hypothetical protein C7B82_19505 [Stenomitos frigidus ULC18]
MKGYLVKVLDYFKALIRKLTRFSVQKPQRKFPSNKALENKLEKSVGNSLSSSAQVESLDEPVISPDVGVPFQKPSNYPPMLKRELLIDRPFEFDPERHVTGSSSAPTHRQTSVERLTTQPVPFSNKIQRTEKPGQKRPYIECHTDELESMANSAWNDLKVLSEIRYELQFRSRAKAQTLLSHILQRLAELQDTRQFAWPSTTARAGLQNLSDDVFKEKEGILKLYGYRVGLNGLPEKQRRQILDNIFLHPLPSINDASYLNEWGLPRTAKRLQKLAKSIAAFTCNAKRRRRAILLKQFRIGRLI